MALDLWLIAANGHVLLHAKRLHLLNLIVHELCLIIFSCFDSRLCCLLLISFELIFDFL